MAKFSMAQRKRIPKGKFGIPSKAPGRGSYPMNDRSHAIAAKRLSARGVKAGNISSSTRAKIVAKANRILGGNAMDAAARAMRRKKG